MKSAQRIFSGKKHTALEYEYIGHNSQENVNDHKEIPFFICHSRKGHRAVMLVEVWGRKTSMQAGTAPVGAVCKY